MNLIAKIFRTMLFLPFIFLIIGLVDLAIYYGASFLFSLSWIWYLVIMIFLWSTIYGLFSLLIMGAMIGLAALFKPNFTVTIIVTLTLSILNFIGLAIIVWNLPGSSIWMIIAKLIATGFVFQINYLVAGIGVTVAQIGREEL